MSTQSEHSMPIVPVSSDIPTVENINRTPTEAEVSLSRPESPEIAENFEPELEAENNGAFYHRGFKAESVAEYMYKIRDDSVKPRQFLGTDTEDGIEAIFNEQQGH
ncbi:11623_t:CDS:1 [Entrophospora sp. SA101]|nr:11623_t:CDS:1 [Entrophospora sp. SA101]